MNAPRELMHFLALSHEEQAAAIRDLAAQGWSDYGIARATRLSVEQVRGIRRTGGLIAELPRSKGGRGTGKTDFTSFFDDAIPF